MHKATAGSATKYVRFFHSFMPAAAIHKHYIEYAIDSNLT